MLHKLVTEGQGNLFGPLENTAVKTICDLLFQKEWSSCNVYVTNLITILLILETLFKANVCFLFPEEVKNIVQHLYFVFVSLWLEKILATIY